jgi:hypothetical protein
MAYNVRVSVQPNELIASLTEPPIQRRLHRPAYPILATCINVFLVCKFLFPAVSTGFRTPY